MERLRKLFLGLALLGIVAVSVPVMAEMEIPRNHWYGTDAGDDATWNNDGSYLELKNDTDSQNVFRIELSSGGTMIGSDVDLTANLTDLELGGAGKVFVPNRMDTSTRDNLNTGDLKTGSVIFNDSPDVLKLEFWNGSSWQTVTSS